MLSCTNHYLVHTFKNVQLIGSIAVAILFLLSIIGSYLAYSPVVRHLEITIDKKIVS